MIGKRKDGRYVKLTATGLLKSNRFEYRNLSRSMIPAGKGRFYSETYINKDAIEEEE